MGIIYIINKNMNLSMSQTAQIEAQLAICYEVQQLRKYIMKQILEVKGLELVKSLARFTMVKFKIPSTSDSYSFTSDNHSIEFVVVLGKNYPMTPPRVHIKTNLLKPGINDCRDLLPHIIGTEDWDYRISLKHIQKSLIYFLSKLKKVSDIYYIARIGNFQLNSVYPIQLINQLRSDNIFYAFEITGESDFKMIIIDVSTTHLAIFITKEQPYHQGQGFKIPAQQEITLCMLNFYAELGSLTEIYVDRTNFSDIQLTFTSQKPHNMSLESRSKTKRLKVKKGLLFLHKLLKNRKYYDSSQIQLSQLVQNMEGDERQILQQIQKAQMEIKHHLNVETIKYLVDMYQSAVQYYSSKNIPYYQIYLEYITKLYQRKDVRMVMGTDLPNQY